MSQFSTSTLNPVSLKAACQVAAVTFLLAVLLCALLFAFTWAIDEFLFLPAFEKAVKEACPAAINFGDDVNTAPTSPTVPVGNTGTTSTGRVL